MKKALAILVFAALSSPMIGQTTSITAVVTDSNSVNWVNSTCTATWIGTGKAIDLNGKSFTTKPTCAVDSSANLTVTVQDVAYIAPPASTWRFCVTPATSQAVTGCTNIAATGASESITTQITAAITPPNVTGGILAQAYADSEVQAVGGNMYYNIVTPAFRCYSTSWATCGGGGGGSGTVTSFSSGNLSPLFTSSVATATTTPALTFTLSNAASYSLIFNNSASPAAPAYVALSSLPVAQFPTLNQATTGNAATSTNMSTSGSSNQVWGMNSGGSAQGWQTVSGGSAFSAITGSTNTTAAMLCGTGCSLGPTGTGTVTATAMTGTGSLQGVAALQEGTGSLAGITLPTNYSGWVGPPSGTAAYFSQMPITAPSALSVYAYSAPSTVNGVSQAAETTIPVASGASVGLGLTQTVASGTAVLGTSAIASGACATTVTGTATGGATTDTVLADFNASPIAITGYGASSTGAVLSIYKWVTSNTVNFSVCNSTSASITPGAATLNWRVVR